MEKRTARRLLTLVISGSIFLWCVRYLASAFEWRAILGILRQADPRWLALAGLTIVAQFLIRTLRWGVMLRRVNSAMSFAEIYFVTVISITISLMTPGQSGEAVKVELLRKHGLIGRLPGYVSFMIERLVDLLVLVLLGLAGLLSRAQAEDERRRLLPGLIGLFALISVILLVLWRVPIGGRLGAWIDRLRSAAGDAATLAKVVALTVLAWTNVVVAWHFCLMSIGVKISLAQTLSLIAVVTLGGLLSLLPSGVGVAEVLTAVVLQRRGVAVAPAQAGALILRCYGLMMIFLGLLHVPVWRLRAVAEEDHISRADSPSTNVTSCEDEP
jgi:uncharacterized membrane protein YbhN (UPF0104 family)